MYAVPYAAFVQLLWQCKKHLSLLLLLLRDAITFLTTEYCSVIQKVYYIVVLDTRTCHGRQEFLLLLLIRK